MSDTDTVEIVKKEIKVTEPSRYKVVFHNDNVTTYQFVIYLLIEIFNKSQADAINITLTVDKQGAGVAGVYSKEIAEHKVSQAYNLILQYEFPLKITIEKE